jgi:hypothetical protein
MAGFGVAGGASLVGFTGVAGAAQRQTSTFPPPPPGRSPGVHAGGLSAAAALTAGLTYRLVDMTSWQPTGEGQFRQISTAGVGVVQAVGAPLAASIDPPIGSILKEVTVWYLPGADMASLLLVKKPLDAPVAVDDMGFPSLPVAFMNPLPTGDGTLQVTLTTDETIDGTGTYPLIFFPSTATQAVAAIRYGYVAAPQAFIPSTPIRRLLDTRTNGGKLRADEERTLNLGVPALARAAVINLTITGTERSGFVAVFPADVAWPGNSSINWFATDQDLANTVITATDSTGRVKLRGGVNATHVVIDVLGFLL